MTTAPKTTLDVAFARQQFPFFQLENPSIQGFFDNAAGTFTANAVIERLNHFYLHNKVQPYSNNPIGKAAGEQMDAGRKAIADLLGLDEETITIGASSTQNFNTLSQACAGFIHEGDEIIVTQQDHESNIGGWERLAKAKNISLKLWPINPETGELELDEFKHLLSDKTKLVSVTHSSNIIGTENPINEIADLAHQVGAKMVVDGVSFAPHTWPDIPSYKVDAYCFSTYKTFGTHHGIMYIAPDFMSLLTPQCHFFNEQTKSWRLLDSAGPDHGSIAALAGLESFFLSMHQHHFDQAEAQDNSSYEKAQEIAKLMQDHEDKLGTIFLEGIKGLPVKLLGKNTMQGREANFALEALEHCPTGITAYLGEAGIAVSNSHFYAYRLLEAMGIKDMSKGIIRISMAHYNTVKEVEKLISLLQDYFAKH
ncbi:hypothetical protein OA92_00245 [Marinomonas sp. SBI22]|uniref:aminotransferase class V-fold PLP-dependent enzyme n=1 Tax=unclassified Marinomonas TaxID=196814 RepID=UPI0007AF599A|nr:MULTISPECIES: aminotransferase class V-fold PLP-dependent enzyme [unclassified Marinomonas]KZM45681.1 hypothetical protein OA92_00245 [Marinomonas sp. SBI22]KZM46200.1 hypothetical protein OA91_04390 [Marinomonas sp. SBI8L]